MSEIIYGSILHGAYGDYYEQALCLKHFRLTHPEIRLKLFAASPHRLAEMQVLDFSWADSLQIWSEIENEQIDRFFQFQVFDPELRADVLPYLSPITRRKIDLGHNRLPWSYLRSFLPSSSRFQLELSETGLRTLPDIMRENGIGPTIFQRPTLGFLWRHRSPGGAIRPTFQLSAEQLVAKYSRLFRRLIDLYGCYILICGMKVPRTENNYYRIDAKFPVYGLDLPSDSSTHLKGLSWALELEILARCTVCAVNPSGFSEALWIKRGSRVLLLDPPVHYVAKVLWRRMPLFNLQNPLSLAAALGSRSESIALALLKRALNGTN